MRGGRAFGGAQGGMKRMKGYVDSRSRQVRNTRPPRDDEPSEPETHDKLQSAHVPDRRHASEISGVHHGCQSRVIGRIEKVVRLHAEVQPQSFLLWNRNEPSE